jgi:dihydrofolate reductase
MRRLITTTFVTLDGVYQAPGGPGEDESGDFGFGGWVVPFWDDVLGQVMEETMSPPFDLVLGRRTYDIFAAYWPSAPEEAGARPLNEATKYVASRGRPQLSWERSVLLEGDVPEAVARLKEEDGPELQVHGSGELLGALLAGGLVDQCQLLVFPVVLGTGKRLFPEGTPPAALRMVHSAVSSTGVFVGRYVPAGEVASGSF